MADLHDKFFPYDDMNVTVLKALARLPLSVNECEELLEMDSHMLMVEHQLDHVQADTVRMWCQHEFQRHSAASVTGASARGAKDLRDMSKWQPSRTYPIKEGNVKITKRQLRRIIKEEKQKILRESVTDMRHYEEAADQAAIDMSDLFYNDMMKMYDEEPEAFAVQDPNGSGMARPDRSVWEQQVVYAQQEIDTAVARAIVEAIQSVEARLHDGEFYDDRN